MFTSVVVGCQVPYNVYILWVYIDPDPQFDLASTEIVILMKLLTSAVAPVTVIMSDKIVSMNSQCNKFSFYRIFIYMYFCYF